jgi:hypothetical protein
MHSFDRALGLGSNEIEISYVSQHAREPTSSQGETEEQRLETNFFGLPSRTR